MTGLVFLAIAWLMPLHFMPWVSWHSEAAGFAAAFAMACAILFEQAKTRTFVLQMPRSAVLFLAFGLVVLIQAALGTIEFWGDAAVLELYAGLCVVGLSSGFIQARRTSQLGNDGLRWRGDHPVVPLAWTLLACSMASAVFALVQAFDVWSDIGWIARMPGLRRPGANLGQPNHLGTLLLMGLASLLYLRERRKLQPLLATTAFAVLALGLAATESRTALLGVLLMSAWALAGRAKRMISMPAPATLAGTAVLVGLYVAWPLLMAAGGTFEAGATVNPRAGWRLIVWPQLLQAIAMRPLEGWGLHEVAKAHNVVASGYEASEPYTYAHNLILELAIGWGIPLTLLAIGVVGIWLWRRLQAARTAVHWYCLAAVLPFCVHSMLEFPYAYAYFLLPVTFLVGVFDAETSGPALPRAATWGAAAALLPVIVLAPLSVYDYLRVEEDFRVARFEALRIGRKPDDYVRPKVMILTQLDALLDAARLEPRVGMPPSELRLARQAAQRYPWPATQNRYALALALNGSSSEAARQLQVIRTLHGEATYRQIEANWRSLASQHPEWAKLLNP